MGWLKPRRYAFTAPSKPIAIASHEPIIVPPSDPSAERRAQTATAEAYAMRAVKAFVDIRDERDTLWGWCFESRQILRAVRDHGMDPLTTIERESVLRTLSALDKIMAAR